MNTRLLLYLGFGFVALLLWQKWAVYQNPVTMPLSSPVAETDQALTFEPKKYPVDNNDLPEAVTTSAPKANNPEQSSTVDSIGAVISVQTDVLNVEIDTNGGDIRRIDLRKIPVSMDKDAVPFRLLKSKSDGDIYIMQSGLLHDRLPDVAQDLSARAPTHHALYQSQQYSYTLHQSEGSDVLRVNLLWHGPKVTVEKIYIFRSGSYLIDLEHIVRNTDNVTWLGRQYAQLRRTPKDDTGGNQFIYTFTGGTYYDGTYNKIGFDDMEDQSLQQSIQGGWVAMIEHYFVSALIPEHEQILDYYTKVVPGTRNKEYIIGMRSEPLPIPAGDTGYFKMKLYAGPKLQSNLEGIAPGLELTTDYGIFSVISKPLFWLLEKIHNFIGNWGWSIVLLTFLIKLLFYKLSEVSYKSMAKMRKFQPRLLLLRERYKDDRQRLNQEMMVLYRKEKVNPLGGCLPILVQIPVFIALYWVLLESVELRHAPFIFWITDLSAKDPYFVLPLLMGITMFLQNRLNPTPPDPIQAKVMMFLPLIFTFFFAFFPSGLVLYWVVNNILSISQQWVITRRIERMG